MSEESVSPENYEAKIHIAGVCSVVRTETITPHMRRITLHGNALQGLERFARPEMLIRLYFPPQGSSNPPEPYLAEGGVLLFNTTAENEVSPFSAFSEDPLVRAYTARHYRADKLELDIDFVLHDDMPGLASDWARVAKPGDRIGVVEFGLPPSHKPAAGRGADVYVMFADEAALPAAHTNFEAFLPGEKVIAFLEVSDKSEEQPINCKADLTVTWLHRGDKPAGTSGLLVKAAKELEWPQGKVFAWVCAEIRTVTEIRRFVKKERGLQKGSYKTQAYWRLGATEVERMARMTELSMAAAETDPASFMESFEEIGMNIEDPTLLERNK